MSCPICFPPECVPYHEWWESGSDTPQHEHMDDCCCIQCRPLCRKCFVADLEGRLKELVLPDGEMWVYRPKTYLEVALIGK